MDDFQTWLTNRDRAEKTVAGYLADLGHFSRWFEQTNGEPLIPKALTPTDIREYRGWMQARKSQPSTINRHLAAIRAYSAWAIETGQSASDPARGIRQAEAQKLAPKWLDRKQQRDLVQAAEAALNTAKTDPAKRLAQRDVTIIKTLLHTGLRVGELCALALDDLELSPKKGKIIVRQGKGEKRREVPVNAEAREAISKWLELRGRDPGLLFSSQRGDGITGSGIHRRLAELGRITNAEVHAHTLRHTFAKNLIDAGVGLERVAALLGHSNLNTTRIYTTPGERDLEAAVERLAG
jgi:integrase/recombinase XerC